MLLALSLLLLAGLLAVFAPAIAEWLRPADTVALPIAAAYVEDQHRAAPAYRAWRAQHRVPRSSPYTGDHDDQRDLAPMHADTDVSVPAATRLRAFYSEQQVWLEPGVTVEDWVYGRAVVALADTHLSGSVEAAERVHLVSSAHFERLHAPVVQFGPQTQVPEAPYPLVLFETEATHSLRPLVTGTVVVPERCLLDEDLVVTGDLHVGAGARVRGSVKAGGKLVLDRGAVVEGNAFAAGDLVLGPHARVYGVASSEADVYAATGVRVGLPDRLATLTGEHLRVAPGVTVHGTVWARREGILEGHRARQAA